MSGAIYIDHDKNVDWLHGERSMTSNNFDGAQTEAPRYSRRRD